jgi:hypothetical protein
MADTPLPDGPEPASSDGQAQPTNHQLLLASNKERMVRLLNQGVQLPDVGLMYCTAMLEALVLSQCGPGELRCLRVERELGVARMLDELEKQVKRSLLVR